MKRVVVVVLCGFICGCVFSAPAFAGAMSNYELSERIRQLEEKMEEGILPEGWANRISVSGAMEVEAGFEKTDFRDPALEDEDTSDVSLSTVELGVDVDVTKYINGHVLFLYEDGEDITVDEGYIRLNGGEVTPLYLKAGEFYVPFGNFESNMISDPLTLELGETRETAIQVGFDVNGFYGALYAFNGDMDEDGEESHVDNFGAGAGYGVENDSYSLDLGVDWISNIADSDGCTDAYGEAAAEAEGLGVAFALDSYVPGIAAHAIFTVGSVTMIGEYVVMLEKPQFNVTDLVPGSMAGLGLSAVEEAKKISAWNLELAYALSLFGKESTLAIGYQSAKDSDDWLPEKRYLGSIGVNVMDGTTLALEYRHDEFESDDKTDAVTAKLAIEF